MRLRHKESCSPKRNLRSRSQRVLWCPCKPHTPRARSTPAPTVSRAGGQRWWSCRQAIAGATLAAPQVTCGVGAAESPRVPSWPSARTTGAWVARRTAVSPAWGRLSKGWAGFGPPISTTVLKGVTMSPQLLLRLRRFVDGQAICSLVGPSIIHGMPGSLQRGNVLKHFIWIQRFEREDY